MSQRSDRIQTTESGEKKKKRSDKKRLTERERAPKVPALDDDAGGESLPRPSRTSAIPPASAGAIPARSLKTGLYAYKNDVGPSGRGDVAIPHVMVQVSGPEHMSPLPLAGTVESRI